MTIEAAEVQVDFRSNLLVQLLQELIQSQSAAEVQQIQAADITEIILYLTRLLPTAVAKVELVHHKMVELEDRVEQLDITQLEV